MTGRSDRTVAVKVLRPERSDPSARKRFVQEARAAASIQSDYVVQVYSVSSPEDGPPYLVMPYIQGPTLRDQIKVQRRLDPRRAAAITLQIAKGLAQAHRAGLVHRDVKPANILLDGQGDARLMDFGLAYVVEQPAQLTREGTLAGTPEYMSPEQARGERVDARTDLYSLGVTLYEALTGEPPFRGVTHMVLRQLMEDDPLPPRRLNHAIPRDLQTICLKAMAKDAGRRYASADELAADLERFLNDEPIRARPVSQVEQVWRWCRRHPRESLLAAALLVVLLGGLIWTDVLRTRAEQARATSMTQERAQRRERLLSEIHLVRQAPRRMGWSQRAWALAREAATLEDEDRRVQGAAVSILMDLDIVCDQERDILPVDASSVAFDAAGMRVAAGGITPNRRLVQGKPARLWDLESNTERASSLCRSGPVAFRRDGTAVQLAASEQPGSLVLWSLQTDRSEATFQLSRHSAHSGHSAAHSGHSERSEESSAATAKTAPASEPHEYVLALSSQAEWVAAAGPGGGAVWRADGEKRFELPVDSSGPITAMAFSLDRPPSLLAVARGELIDLWSLAEGRRSERPLGPQRHEVRCLAFSPDAQLAGERFPGLGWLAVADDGGTRLWDLSASQPPRYLSLLA